MMVPTDLQVRLERFRALWLLLRACTVSTGLEGCQRECTRARSLADSRTLDPYTSFVAERTLERRLRVRSRDRSGDALPRHGRRHLRVARAGRRGLLESARRGALG